MYIFVIFREPVIAVALLVNATVILLCIFVRKIYLLNKIQKEIDEEERKSAYTQSIHGEFSRGIEIFLKF